MIYKDNVYMCIDIICKICNKESRVRNGSKNSKKGVCQKCYVNSKLSFSCTNCKKEYTSTLSYKDIKNNNYCFECSYKLTRYNDINKISKEEKIEYTCVLCNNKNNVLKRQYIRKKRKDVCASCSSKLNANSLKNSVRKYWDNLSEEERVERNKLISKKTKERYKICYYTLYRNAIRN